MGANQQALLMATSAVTYAFVNSAQSFRTDTITKTIFSATSLTTGNNIFVYCTHEDATTSMTCTDTAGNTYIGLTATNRDNLVEGKWFYCLNATGHASNVVLVTLGAARAYIAATTVQFTGVGAAYDTETSGQNTATTVTSSSFNTAAGGLVLAGRGIYNAQTSTSYDSGLTMVDNSGNSTTNYSSVGYLLTSSALSAQTITETGNSSTRRCLQIAAFK